MSSVKQKTPNYLTLLPSQRVSFTFEDPSSPINQTINLDVKKQINDKFKTFTNWNYRQLTQKIKKNNKQDSLQNGKTPRDNNQLIKALLNMSNKVQKETKVKNVVDQLVGIKAQRRQRFKKSQNPLHFIKHYMERENFKPSEEEMFLIERTVELKKFVESSGVNLDIEKVLRSKHFVMVEIYTLMNLSVDCNQLRFLILLILLAADICYQVKDENRAFYFYNEARVAATYANISQIKTQSLMGLGLVTMSIGLWDEAIIILKKNLQYAWQSKNTQAQLMIYDIMGSCYYSQGKMKQAQYYHTRYIQNEVQNPDSAIKRISNQMLNDYYRRINSLQKQNLTSLFIQYLNLPITNFQKVPIPDPIKKNYANYKNGQSPRKRRPTKRFDFKDFPPVHQQIHHLLNQDYQFITEIPNPDMHRNYVAMPKFGRKRKSQQFQQSSEFHRIIGTKPPKLNFQDIYKYPLQKRIERALSQKKNQNWWETMLSNTKKQRTQKVGSLKQKVRMSHLSYHKYPEQRKRSQSLKSQKIKESFNKTLLDWIDPIK